MILLCCFTIFIIFIYCYSDEGPAPQTLSGHFYSIIISSLETSEEGLRTNILLKEHTEMIEMEGAIIITITQDSYQDRLLIGLSGSSIILEPKLAQPKS